MVLAVRFESDCREQTRVQRGRGAVSNRTSRYESDVRVPFDDGWESVAECHDPIRTTVTDEPARTIITRNMSPDLGFDRSINPYRGCEHGCVYCFARPTHAFLGLSPGLDFETRLFAKPDAAVLLRNELAKPSYRPRSIAIGTNTDPYQPIEKERGIMRSVLDVLEETAHPVGIVTKGGVVMRDADILGRMGRKGIARVAVSITTRDHRLSRSMEPRASSPKRRMLILRRLAQAGCPVGVMVAPVIPGLNDHEIEGILAAAAEAGASFAGYTVLRLPREVQGLFSEWLDVAHPGKAKRVLRSVRELHGGDDRNLEFGARLRGRGITAKLISERFRKACVRVGLERRPGPLRTDLFLPPRSRGHPQRELPLLSGAG